MKAFRVLAPILLFSTIFSSIFSAACGVPKDEHQKTLDQLAKTQTDLAHASADADKCKNRAGSLENENKKLGGELSNASNKAVSLEENLSKTSGELTATKAELDELRRQRAQAEARMKTFRDLALRLKAMVDSGKLQVQIRKGKMVVKLADNVLFAPGSATLKKEGQSPLAEVATALKEIKDRDFLVTGHTDNTPIHSARFPSNWELSTQRAVDVVKFLASQGVDGVHLAAAGYAENDPIAANDSSDHKQANRRIEIVVMPNIEELPKLDDK
jgi:chemotaxis protein MotB